MGPGQLMTGVVVLSVAAGLTALHLLLRQSGPQGGCVCGQNRRELGQKLLKLLALGSTTQAPLPMVDLASTLSPPRRLECVWSYGVCLPRREAGDLFSGITSMLGWEALCPVLAISC